MKILVLIFFLQSCAVWTMAQSKYFEKKLAWAPINGATSILTETDGSYIIAGSYIDDTQKSFLLKINEYGDTVFLNKNLQQIGQTSANDLIKTNDGYALTGCLSTTSIATECNTYLMKFNTLGQVTDLYYPLGNDTYNTAGITLTAKNNGNIIVGGVATNNDWQLRLLETTPSGMVLWDSVYSNYTYGNQIRDILVAADGSGYYALGAVNIDFDTFPYGGNVLLMKVGNTGTRLVEHTYNLGTYDFPIAFNRTHDSGFIIGGSFDNKKGGLLKLKSDYTVAWWYPYFGYGEITGVTQLADSSYVAGGSDWWFNVERQFGIVKVDSLGNELWHRRYGGIYDDYGYCFAPTLDGGFIMAGRQDSIGVASVYIVKTNCMGLLTEPQAAFSATMDTAALTASFQNLSQFVYPDSIDGGHYVWEFGDGAVSSEINPTHTYTQEGVYIVKLTAVVCSDTSTTYQSICIGTSAHPSPSFSHNLQNDNLVTFTNTSSNAAVAVFIWDFGDGTVPQIQTDSNSAITHTYTQAGEHEVRLSVVLCQDTTVFVQVVTTFAVGIPSMGMGGFMVYPNPAQDYLVVENHSQEQSATFVLYDVLGRQVLSVISHNQSVVSVEHLPSGVYLYQFLNPQNQMLTYGKVSVVR
ncbi:MAG: PKD domain-containing protein [Chitinophagales bacterium]|nr:PKD domain-containing protein [Chitinophagales bacterium]